MKAITVALISILVSSCGTQSDRKKDNWSSIDSYRKARPILDSAIVALGGLEKIRSLDQVTIEYNGLRQMINQSRKPEGPWDAEPSVGKIHVDRKNDRIYTENANFYPGIGSYAGAMALVGTEGFGVDYQKNYHGTEAWKISGQPAADYQWSACSRWIPPLLAMQALDNNVTLRYLGSKVVKDRTYHVVAFVQPSKAYLTMLFDEGTNLLSGYETIRDDGVYGDVTETVIYSDFTDFGGVKLPVKRTDYLDDELARELSFNVSVNQPMDDAAFLLPAGHTMPVESKEPYVRIRKIADGVYMDQDMGGILIIEFKDFCVALDCPDNFAASQSTMDAMREILPGKPIRYVATSHTHGDHGGGVRAYYHSGATLITTPGHVDFYRKIATIHQSISPDSLFYSRKVPIIETFTEKKIISDETQTLELYNIGKNMHTDEMTIAWLPRQKILWQADQFFIPYTGGRLNTAMPVTIEFAKKLMELKLTDFETIIDPHYTRLATKRDFTETLRKAGFNEFR